jgi:hypothetical protein
VIERRAGAIDCDIVAIDGRFIVTLAPDRDRYRGR